MGTKQCKMCGQELPLEMFYKNGTYVDCYCKSCRNQKTKEARIAKAAKKSEAQKVANTTPLNAKTLHLSDGTVLKKVEKTEDTKSLAGFTSRELLVELKARGYEWQDMWCKRKVNYNDI